MITLVYCLCFCDTWLFVLMSSNYYIVGLIILSLYLWLSQLHKGENISNFQPCIPCLPRDQLFHSCYIFVSLLSLSLFFAVMRASPYMYPTTILGSLFYLTVIFVISVNWYSKIDIWRFNSSQMIQWWMTICLQCVDVYSFRSSRRLSFCVVEQIVLGICWWKKLR